MPYSDMFKRKMIQRMTGQNPISAYALSKQVNVSQTTLSKWLRKAGIDPVFGYPNNSKNPYQVALMSLKQPNKWSAEQKLKIVLEADSLSDEQLGAFLRRKGLHETHLNQWRTQMLKGLKETNLSPKAKRNSVEAKKIRALEKELKRKEKALAETAALLVLKKKVQQIWGDEDDDTPSNSGKKS